MTEDSAKFGIAQPILRADADEADELVDEPEVVVQHQLPDGADDDARHQDRQKEDRAIDDLSAHQLVGHQRQGEADHHLQGHGHEGEDDRVADSGPEQHVRPERGKMLEPDEAPARLAARPVDLVDAHQDELQQRQDGQKPEQQQRRRKGKPTPEPIAALVGPAGSRRDGWRPGRSAVLSPIRRGLLHGNGPQRLRPGDPEGGERHSPPSS